MEASRIHHDRLATRGAEYDPFVRSRLDLGRSVADADYARQLDERAKLIRAMDERLSQLDALVLPTTPIVAPTMAAVATLEGFSAANRLLLRNTAFANFFDLCAISLPTQRGEGLPTALTLVARRGEDRRLFDIAGAVERLP